MIVCVCKNINTAKIQAAVEAGACTLDAVRAVTGAASCCGKCQFKVNRVVQNVLSEQAVAAQQTPYVEINISA